MGPDWEEFTSVITSPTPDDFLSSQDRNTFEINRDSFHKIKE